MKIEYIKYDQIDFQKWDQCISKAINRKIYGFSWYLDAVCKKWDAIILDDYLAVFPLPNKSKFFISYIFQPEFTQQLGIFYSIELPYSILNQIINAIPPKFKYIDIYLNDKNLFLENPTLRKNYLLNLNFDYIEIYKNYNENRKRDLKKFDKSGVIISKTTQLSRFIQFIENILNIQMNIYTTKQIQILNLILESISLKSKLELIIATKDGIICSGAAFIKDKNSITYICGASDLDAKKNGVMTKIFDFIIQENCNSNKFLDFEGSNDENIAKFYESFGGINFPYPIFKLNRLNPILKILKK